MARIIGAYAIQHSILDAWLALVFGVPGCILRKPDFRRAPPVVALAPGGPTEETLRRSLIVSDGSMAIFFLLPVIQRGLGRLRRRRAANPPMTGARAFDFALKGYWYLEYCIPGSPPGRECR